MPDLKLQVLTELLVLRAQGGNTDAVDCLIRAWHDRLLHHARRMTGRDDGGEDVMQDAWMQIIRGLSRLDDPTRFGPWAYQIVTRRCALWIRQVQRRRDIEKAAPTHQPGKSPDTPSDQADDLHLALRKLPPDQKAILELRYVEGFGIDQIAQAMDIPPGTAKSRLFHARDTLRGILERIQK